jgi:lysophospholipase L1-like esterase
MMNEYFARVLGSTLLVVALAVSAHRTFGRPHQDLNQPQDAAGTPQDAAGQPPDSADRRGGRDGRGPGRGGISPTPADQPVERTDQNSRTAHQQHLEKIKQGRIDVYFAGDSILRRWGATDYPELLANWKENFHGWNAADFAWGGDSTQNILWRLENGEIDGVNPKVIVFQGGTNNIGTRPGDDAKIEDVTRGVQAILARLREKAPEATIIVTAIFPRNDNIAVMPTIDRINENIAKLADGDKIRFLNINDKLADEEGRLREGMMADGLHPTLRGYQVWADALIPILTELLGPPATEDLAPPPTGDPSASNR